MTNSLCVSPPSSIFEFPEWKEVDKFAYSATDILSWVRCLQIGVRPGSWIKKAISNSYKGREHLKSQNVDGVFERDQICSVFHYTQDLAIRFNLDCTLPSYPEERLLIGVAIDTLYKLGIILTKLVSTDRYKSRNEGFYQLGCSLRGYATTLKGILYVMDGLRMQDDQVKAWADEKYQHLAQCREEVDCVSVVSLPELIPSDWRETVSDVGDLACQIVANILDAYVNVKIMTWKPDKVSVTRIREAMWQIGDWSITFSIQADELPTTLPALAAEKPTVERVPLVVAASEAAKPPRDGRGKNIDAKMLKIMVEFPASHSWTIREWADHLECGPSTVGESKTWTERLSILKTQNAIDATEKMDKSRTNPKGKRKPKHVSDD